MSATGSFDSLPPAQISAELRRAAETAKGFMPADEGDALHRLGIAAMTSLPTAPGLEVGSYCGKSAILLGAAARAAGNTFFTVDHHRGSEENQAGWEHHDTTLVDAEFGLMDTLPVFRKTIARAGLETEVVALVGHSATIARHWRTPLSLVFIDGGHSEEPAQADYSGFAPWLQVGGILAIHDVFESPDDGGQAPFHVWQRAVDSGAFEPDGKVGSLRWLRRRSGRAGERVG